MLHCMRVQPAAQDTGALRELEAAVRQLSERVERLERHQARFQESVIAQLRRTDMASEDLVAALESVRGRVEALEPSGARPAA